MNTGIGLGSMAQTELPPLKYEYRNSCCSEKWLVSMFSLICMRMIAAAAALYLVIFTSPIYCRSQSKADGHPLARFPPTHGRMSRGLEAFRAPPCCSALETVHWSVPEKWGEQEDKVSLSLVCLPQCISPVEQERSRHRTEMCQWVTVWSLFYCWELCDYTFPLSQSRLQGDRWALRLQAACQWQTPN